MLVGEGPVTGTLARPAAAVDFEVRTVEAVNALQLEAEAIPPGTRVVVATHGRFDEKALAWALRSEARYVRLVASPTRARAVVEALRARGVLPGRPGRLKPPAGLDLGAATPEEIAVSILAEPVRARRSPSPALPQAGPAAASAPGAPPPAAPGEARDPVCGMPVQVAAARHVAETGGRRASFCGAPCKARSDRSLAACAETPA